MCRVQAAARSAAVRTREHRREQLDHENAERAATELVVALWSVFSR
ncbi:hypothetical protein [Streptomyces sp. NPDC052292]